MESGFYEALTNGVADQIGGLVDIELVHDSGAVAVRGFYADAEAGGDFLGRIALGDQGNYLTFAIGQFADAPGGAVCVRFEHQTGNGVRDLG